MSAALVEAGIAFGRVAFVMAFVLNVAAILGWVERKQSAIMQDRIGANRASIFGFRALGLFHPLADTLKMLTKEDFRPARADRLLFELAPFVSVFFSLVAFASIPFGDTLTIGDRVVPLQAITLNVGVLYVFAMLSLGVYGVMMAGWSSSNNYALLGGQRAAALMISAEIAIGASIMGVVMIYGSLNLQDIVRGQGALLMGWLPAWGIITQPLAFVVFLTAGIAATKRIPFDTPEGESEIIGYFVEYSGMKFGMFLMTDMVETTVIAGLCTSMFLGGWQVPFLLADGFHLPWGAFVAVPALVVTLLQVGSFVTKVAVMIFILMLIRWTLPRFRYDQAMRLGWLGLFPLSVLNIVLTGALLLLWGGAMKLGQRFYLREVVSGLVLTAGHFFRNMGKHIAHAFGQKSARGAVTIQYPEERRPYSPRLRSLHRLVRRADGSPRCVACMMCETVCPAHCIYIVATEHPNPDIEKMPERFDIDLGKCVFCGYCVEACPEDAIRMDTGILEFSSYSRRGMIYSKEMLLSLEPVGADGRPTSPVPIPADRTP